MKREIKFRAWNKILKKMMKVGKINWGNRELWVTPEIQYVIAGGYTYSKAQTEAGWGRLIDIELMQFTGIQDKNGQEIYEGDILKVTRKYNSGHIKFGKVIFKDGCWQIYYGNLIYDNISELIRADGIFEVNGNIYENPELLEVA